MGTQSHLSNHDSTPLMLDWGADAQQILVDTTKDTLVLNHAEVLNTAIYSRESIISFFQTLPFSRATHVQISHFMLLNWLVKFLPENFQVLEFCFNRALHPNFKEYLRTWDQPFFQHLSDKLENIQLKELVIDSFPFHQLDRLNFEAFILSILRVESLETISLKNIDMNQWSKEQISIFFNILKQELKHIKQLNLVNFQGCHFLSIQNLSRGLIQRPNALRAEQRRRQYQLDHTKFIFQTLSELNISVAITNPSFGDADYSNSDKYGLLNILFRGKNKQLQILDSSLFVGLDVDTALSPLLESGLESFDVSFSVDELELAHEIDLARKKYLGDRNLVALSLARIEQLYPDQIPLVFSFINPKMDERVFMIYSSRFEKIKHAESREEERSTDMTLAMDTSYDEAIPEKLLLSHASRPSVA